MTPKLGKNESSAPRRQLLVVLSTGAMLASLFVFAVPAQGDVVRLRTGESIKGRLLQASSDPDVLVVEDFLSGSMRKLSWDVVTQSDRNRIQEDWGWKNKSKRVVKAHRVRHKLSNGDVFDILGLVEERTQDGGVKIRVNGRVETIPGSRVVGDVQEEELDPRDIWSTEQLYQRFLDDLSKEEGVDIDNLSSIHRWRCAEMAEWVGELNIALEHYNACANDESFTRAAVAKNRAANVKLLLADAAGLATLKKIRRTISSKKYHRAREMIEGFVEAHPDSRQPVLDKLEKVKSRFEAGRTEFFQREVANKFIKTVDKLISVKVREKDLVLGDATGWTRRELPEEAFKQLAARLARHDDITAEQARTFWDGRKKRSWTSATFGAGTFVVRPPKIKAPKRRRGGTKRKKSKGPQVNFQPPKPPTRDGWWEGAKSRERQSWLMAFFVENSGLFEIRSREQLSNCPICNGEGLGSKNMSNGSILFYLCQRCGGAQQDVRLRFR